MHQPHPTSRTLPSRREAIHRLGAMVLGLAAAGCTPNFLVHSLYPEAPGLDEATVARTLEAFIATVLPDADEPGRVAKLFVDPALRFAPYCPVLVADLHRRARESSGKARFDLLPGAERVDIVRRALAEGGSAARLYTGGIFLAQVAYYGGLWHERGACPSIGFEGPYVFAGFAALTYPEPERFLPAATTLDGNPA